MRIFGACLAVAGSLALSGCEAPDAVLVASRPSPDGTKLLRVTKTSGGIQSSLITVHITEKTGEMTAQNMILTTPDCAGGEIGWLDSRTVLITYDRIFASNYWSSKGDARVLMIDRTGANEIGKRTIMATQLPCDSYEPA